MGILLEIQPARMTQASDDFSTHLPSMLLLLEDEWGRAVATKTSDSMDTAYQSLLRTAHRALGALLNIDDEGEGGSDS